MIDPTRIHLLETVGRGVLRYGLVGLLLFWGSSKFEAGEAEAIRPLIAHHPLMSWMHSLFGVRGASAVIGVAEVTAALLMAARRFAPLLSGVGSLIASGIFVGTVSFLFTTPGALDGSSSLRGFLLKDVILLGAALYTAAEALGASTRARR